MLCRKNEITSLVINPETAPIVKMIYEKYLDGLNNIEKSEFTLSLIDSVIEALEHKFAK